MLSRLFKDDVGPVLEFKAPFKQRLLAKLDAYLSRFDEASPTYGAFYARTHQDGKQRAMDYRQQIESQADDKALVLKVYRDSYLNDALGSSTKLRRYLEAALFELFTIRPHEVEAAEAREVEQTCRVYLTSTPLPGRVDMAKAIGRQKLVFRALQLAEYLPQKEPVLEQGVPMQLVAGSSVS